MLTKFTEADGLPLVIETVGAVAQLGEHLLCKQGVSGSIPLSSTIRLVLNWRKDILGEIKFASALGPDACSDYIVKRRYVWKLPGVEGDRKVVRSVRAQS